MGTAEHQPLYMVLEHPHQASIDLGDLPLLRGRGSRHWHAMSLSVLVCTG